MNALNKNKKENEIVKVLLTNKKNFLKDFVFWFALASLCISIYTLCSTVSESKSQNKKWETINSARISITDVKFLMWRKISFEDLHKKDWGYNPTATQYLDEPDYDPNEVILPYKLVAVNKVTNEPVNRTSSMKVNDLNKELISGSLNPSKYDFKKYYKIIITMQNVGQTPGTIDSGRIQNISFPNWKDSTIPLQPNNFTLDAGQKYLNQNFGYFIKLDEIPGKYNFDYNVYYTDINGNHKSTKVTISGDNVFFKILNQKDSLRY